MSNSVQKGVLLLTFSLLLFMVSSYLINLWLARSLGPVHFGIYGVVLSLVNLVNVIQSSGLPQVISKFISQEQERSESLLKSGLELQAVTSVMLTIVFYLSAKPLSIIFRDPNLRGNIELASLIFPVYGILTLYQGYYNGMHEFVSQSKISAAYSIFKMIFVLGFALFFNIKGAIIGFIVAPFLALLVGLKLPGVHSSFPYKKIALFSLPLVGFALLTMLLQSIDLYFVKALISSKEDPGYYTANQNIARIPFFALSAFSLVLFPSISRHLAQNQIEKIRSMIHSSLRFILMLLIPGTLLIAVTSGQIIDLLYSAAYLPAAPSLSILIFASGFLTIFTVLANILNGAGSPRISLAISALGVVITAIFCLMLVATYGLVGAAISTTIGSFVAMVAATYFVYKRFNALVPIKSAIKIIFASLVISLIAYLITLPVILLPLLYIVLFMLYGGLLVVMKELTYGDFRQMRELLPVRIPFVA